MCFFCLLKPIMIVYSMRAESGHAVEERILPVCGRTGRHETPLTQADINKVIGPAKFCIHSPSPTSQHGTGSLH